jgi:multidrug efflux pump subunit AcrA (membrane-fusion protein)
VAYADALGAAEPRAVGALVPDSAVVQWEGLAWAYRAHGASRFERVRVVTDHPAPGGWVVNGPLAAGDSVVVRGAEELLSEEFRARVTVGDESGE